MTEFDVVALTQELVAINSVSQWSNVEITERLSNLLEQGRFEVEWLEFVDVNGERKASLVARKGKGAGGLGFFSHSDTVPGTGWERDPFSSEIHNGRVLGLGSCDMKGPLAATLVAALSIEERKLRQPLYVVVTADEEITGLGAQQVAQESRLFQSGWPTYGVIAEPTQLVPVYAHKGGGRVIVTAHGTAAHTSTDRGISANLLIAPFLAEVADYAKQFKLDPTFMNQEFDPPTNGFNMVLDDGSCKANITAARTVCTLSFRPMPNDRSHELITIITQMAERYGFEVRSFMNPPFYVSPDAPVVLAALEATGANRPGTVAFGSDSVTFRHYLQLVLLGPGNIAHAHSIDEHVDIRQLVKATEIYRRLISLLCEH
jgi:acetylornithine deacetylase